MCHSVGVETPKTAAEPMLWSGWGDPDRAADLPEPIRGLLADLLGVRPPATPAVRLEEVRLPAPALPEEVLGELRGVVGPGHVHCDDEARIRRTRGRSTPDLLR